MSARAAVVYLTEDTVRVKDRSGRRYDVDPTSFMQDAVGVTPGSDVRIQFRNSRRFFSTLLAVSAHSTTGRVGLVKVRSPAGNRTTTCGPLEVLTARAALGTVGLADHPAAFLARFAPAGNPQALAAVVGRVFDPRWFIHPERPDRLSRLEAAFGLLPQFDRRPRAHHWRTTLSSAWGADSVDWSGAGLRAGPDDFYRRMAARELAFGPPERAARRVGRHFLKALFAVWSDARTICRGVNLVEPMFVPERLFDGASVAAVRATKEA